MERLRIFFIYCFSFYLYFSLSCMYSLTSGTYLIHNFPSLACVSSPLAHIYFIFFLFSHVFPCLRTYLFHLFSLFACIPLPPAHTYFIFFLISHVFSYFWHIPISSFFFFRMYFFASGTYLIHNSPLPRMYFTRCSSYISYACIIFTN